MTELQAKNLAEELMAKHLPKRWTYKTNNRTSSLGLCDVNTYTIEMSTHTIHAGKETFMRVLLHEIAHALDWERHKEIGHGSTWKHIMLELGQEPSRLASEEDTDNFTKSIKYKYDIVCSNPDCNVKFHRMRKAKSTVHWVCKECSEKGIESKFIWTKNF